MQWLILVNTKKEIQSALWTRATINLFTLARFVNQEVTCHLFVLDNYKKDKDAIFACLQKFYGNTTTFLEEHFFIFFIRIIIVIILIIMIMIIIIIINGKYKWLNILK